MFITLVLLLACALLAIVSVPLMLKLIPPNPLYGFRTQKAMSNPEVWFAVNAVGGRALLVASGLSALALMGYSGTWLRSPWAQLAALVIPLVAAIVATLAYERRL
jgi:SdpI/YfhL protein family